MTDSENIIALDDAGIGNIYGGAVIGAMNRTEYRHRIIGPEWFELGSALKPIVSFTVIELILTMCCGKKSKPDKIILCRSDFFNSAARDLTRLGYNVSRECITGELQRRIEEDFYDHLISLGLPAHIKTIMPSDNKDKEKYYRALNEFSLSYILAHPEERIRFAKSNCNTFDKIKCVSIEKTFFNKLNGRTKRCVECGGNIRSRCFKCEGAGRIFYVHERCAKWV